MRNDGTDWEALVDKRLAEARQKRRDEAQAAEPPPGPEAAAQVIDRIRAAQDADAADLADTADMPLPPPAGARRPSRGRVRPPMSDGERRASERHLRSFSWRRAKRTLFLLILVALFLGGIGLVFWPQLQQVFRFLGPDRDTAENGLVAPREPAGKPEAPKPPAKEPPPVETAPKTEPPKTIPLPSPLPDPAPEKKPPEATKPEPVVKPPEKKPEEDKKPIVPIEPAKPIDPATLPKPQEPLKPLPPPKIPWDDQGREKPRPVDPRDGVG